MTRWSEISRNEIGVTGLYCYFQVAFGVFMHERAYQGLVRYLVRFCSGLDFSQVLVVDSDIDSF